MTACLGVDREYQDVPKIYFMGIILHRSLGNRFRVFRPRKTCPLSTSILVALFVFYYRFNYFINEIIITAATCRVLTLDLALLGTLHSFFEFNPQERRGLLLSAL